MEVCSQSLVEFGSQFFCGNWLPHYAINDVIKSSKKIYNRVVNEHLKTHQNREAIENRESNPHTTSLL